MSGLAGVFMRAGEPADVRAVRRMALASPARERDGAWTFARGPFAAVRQRTVTTLEDEAEERPVVDEAAGLVMVFDGRLDNRAELSDALGIPPPERRTLADAWLALAAWKRWGGDTPPRLLGDFALAVWSARDRSLWCARDPMGVRPFFYHLSHRAFVFASELRQVLAHPLVPGDPDEATVGRILSGRLPRAGEGTLYRGVRRLPHGHALAVAPHRAAMRRYVRADLERELRLSGDAEYAAAFCETLTRAVAARLRSRGAVGAYLSGGLDSSSVVAAAAALARAQGTPPPIAFSLVFPGEPAADEREYSEAVLRHTGVEGEAIVPAPMTIERVRAEAASRRELPDFPNDLAGDAVRRAMARRGVRVALTGSGGDVGLSGSHFHYADLLRRFHVVRFVRRYVDVARQPGMGWGSADLLPCAIWPLLPRAVRGALRPLVRRRHGAPRWIAPRLAEEAGLAERTPLREVPGGRLARTDVQDGFDNGWVHMALDMYQRGSIERGIEDRHPFFDWRMIAFALSLPDEQRWQRGTTRYVLRRAMSGRLPDVVRDRPDESKADFSHLYLQALEALGGASFFSDGMETAARGWTVPGEARRLYARMRDRRAAGDPAYGDAAFQLWNIAAVEIWHQEVFGPRAGRDAWKNETNRPASRPIATASSAGDRIAARR